MAKRLKIQDRDALREWDSLIKDIATASVVDANEDAITQKKRIARLEGDNEAWFKYYFAAYYKSDPAPFHKRATNRLMKNKRWYEVRAWSRELAKSARSMMEVTKLALTKEISNILLVSNSKDNADRLLMPFMLTLEFNKRIINDYGTQKKPGSWEEGEFTTIGGASFRALGAGQSPRGTRNEAVRPDFILVDDIDTDEECRNPERIDKKWLWIEEALIPTISISGKYRILFNGNIIAKDCCIQRAIKKADKTDIINIRDKQGRSTWPQKNSEADIDKILSLISELSAQKEYFNNPLSKGKIFKELKWGKVPQLRQCQFVVSYSDPAPSNSKNGKGSYKSNFLLGFFNGVYYVFTGYLDHVTNAVFVDWNYGLRDYVNEKTQLYNYIENNTLQNPFYEQVFIPLFREAAKEKGFIGITPDERKKPDKFSRIEGNLEPLNRLGHLILNEREKENPHMQRLEEQFKAISPQMGFPADGPDCIEGGIWIIKDKLAQLTGGSFTIGTRATNKKRY